MIHDILQVAILPSGNISASSTSSVLTNVAYNYLMAQFTVSAVPAGGAPTLDFYLQTSVDGGTTWRDVAHPSQFTTSIVTTFMQVSGLVTGGAATLAASDAALTVNTNVQGPFGDRLRIKYVFAAGGSSGAYTAAVNLVLK